MNIKEYIHETLLIKKLEEDINGLKKEVNELEKEKKLLTNKSRINLNGIQNLATGGEHRPLETIINLDKSTLKRCLECHFINKKYPEVYAYKYSCICPSIDLSLDRVGIAKGITCICNLNKRMKILR